MNDAPARTPSETKDVTARLLAAAVEYDAGDARRIQHFVKVHDFAATIGAMERLGEEELFVLETAAILHDIGIHVCEEKYGSDDGHYQEQEGPAVAEMLMHKVGGYAEGEMNRVKYLIAHHHTYTDIEGMDYQILVESDFLVNLFEEGSSHEAVENAAERIFRTESGLEMLRAMFLQ